MEDHQLQKEFPEVIRVLANRKLAKLLQEYAQQLLDETSLSFKEEVTHYLALLHQTHHDVSKFHIPARASVVGSTSETLDSILAKHPRIVFLGPAGSGKTTELLNLAMHLSKHSIQEIESGQVPVYINMRNWIEGNFIDHLQHIFGRYGLNFTRPMVESLLKNYRVKLLFDGLDEVPPHELPEKINQIETISEIYEGVGIVVSCRTLRYTSELKFPIVHLESLQDADIINYMSEFTGREFNLGRLYSWPYSLRELSRHPLTLNFIANILTEKDGEPASLANVYGKYIDFLFDRWEIRKGTSIDPVWKKRALVSLAVDMQERAIYSVHENEAIDLLRTIVSGEHIDFSTVDLINELVSSGIIRKEGSRYTFWHTSIREYLASQLLIDKIRAGESISDFVTNQAWEQVVIFASGLIDDSHAMSRFLFQVATGDLYLYNRCVAHAVSSTSTAPTLSDSDLTYLILGEMLEARTHVINQWFPALLHLFSPYLSHGKDSQPAIVGRFTSEGGGHLAYGYTIEAELGKKIRSLSEFPAGTNLNSLANLGILKSTTVSRGLPLNEIGIAGAHKIALNDVWRELEDIIRAKRLIEPPRLIYEMTQTEVRYLIRDYKLPVTIPADISLIEEEIEKLLTKYGSRDIMLMIGGDYIHPASLLSKLRMLAKIGYDITGKPLLPESDRIPKGSNWVTQFYEDETLIEYVRLWFYHMLEGYSEMVKLNFHRLSHRFNFHQLLPVRVVAEINRPDPSKDIESLSGCDYYYEPLEGNTHNEVVVSLNQKVTKFLSPSSPNLREARETWLEQLKRYGRWSPAISVSTSRSSLGIFFRERDPIRGAVYEKILEDLGRVFQCGDGGLRL